MLQLSSRSAHRIGSSYICASCFAASHRARLLAPRHPPIPSHHVRLLSITSRRTAPTAETSTPSTGTSDNIEPPDPDPPKKKKQKKKPKTSPSPPKGEADNERQLKVLQGALQALKNVLAAQNIDVDQIGKQSKQGNHEEPTSTTEAKAKDKSKPKPKPKSQPKPKTKSKSKSNAKAAKADKEQIKQSDPEKPPKPGASEGEVVTKADNKSAPSTRPRRAEMRRKARSTRAKEATSSKKPKSKKESLTTKHGAVQDLRESLKGLGSANVNDISLPGTESHSPSQDLRGDYNIIGQPSTVTHVRRVRLSAKKQSLIPAPPPAPAPVPLSINTINTGILPAFAPIEADRPPVPSLSYGLERVLFNPGVYYLQDPRSRVYNFDPYLSEIMPIQEFDFNALKQYVTSSKDSNLIRIAKENDKKYTGSTSSMTSMLSHFHYLLSAWREVNTSMMSRSFVPDSVQFTRIMRGPAAVFLHWKDGTYAIDADKEFDTANILSMLGKSMEKLLTLSKDEYERYRHVNSDQITEEERNAEEAFHYTGFQDFMMRSQLDAHDPRIPGSGMFDLKTRAVISIRMDAKGFQKGLGYEIRNRFGQWESFEREYYDMIRSAFLKYSLQVRMGRMDGIFVAFHNTQRIFGFQYIPLGDMDLALHGTANTVLGDREFKISLALLNDILNRVAEKFPERSLRLHFETRTSVGAPFMYIFAKPVSQDDIDEVQNAGKESIEAFESKMLGLVDKEAETEDDSEPENSDLIEEENEIEEHTVAQEISSLAAWKDVRQMVEEAVDDDEVGVGAVREAIEDALEQSGLLHARSSTEARGYVDALLSAITRSMPYRPEESSPGSPAEEPTTSESSLESTQETSEQDLELSSDEHLVLGDESNTEPSQIHEKTEEKSIKSQSAENQPEETDEHDDDKSTMHPGPVKEDEKLPVAADYQDSQAREAEESVDSIISEKSTSTKVHIEEQPREPVEPILGRIAGEEDNGRETQSTIETSDDSSANIPVVSDNEDGNVGNVSEAPTSIDETVSPEQANADTSKIAIEEEEEEGEEEEEDDESDDMDDELEAGEARRDPNTASGMSPLKDLILRMAQSIDERAISDEVEDSLDDSSKLKEFERILGELIARSKDEQTPPQTDDTSTVLDTQAKSETLSQEESTKSESQEVADTQDSDPQSPPETIPETATASEASALAEEEGDPELLGMVLSIRNKVNGKYVTRPEDLSESDSWSVEYNIEELTGKRAKTIYQQIQSRRQKVFETTGDKETEWYKMFRGKLDEYTRSGREFRAAENSKAKKYPVNVVGQKPQRWADVFGDRKGMADNESEDGRDAQDIESQEKDDGSEKKY